MTEVQIYLRQNFMKLMLTMVAGGFLLLMIELVTSQHFVGVQLIGFFSTLLGFLFTIHGIIQPSARRKLAICLLVLSAFGLLGAYEHRNAHTTKVALIEAQQQLSGITTASNEPSGPPPLAPLSLSGLAVFAMLLLLAAGDSVSESAMFAESAVATGYRSRA